MGAYRAPSKYFFLDELPKGPSGKIQRLKLTERFTD
jgi:acyl-coenzyme A synthetase/AMP-(fatty) acid ligase